MGRADLFPVIQNYAVDRWGGGYFGINPLGHACVRPDPDSDQQVDLYQLAGELQEAGFSRPVLVRFTDILRHRVAALCASFRKAFADLDYPASYTAIYPIKVNQQRSVVQEILAGGNGSIGLEAGSKPELMAVLALSPEAGVIVCNGYKDREYVRLALIGRRLGQRLYIVIEKLSELQLVLKESADLGVEPLLGVRLRLSSSAEGKWQDSGGEKAKFGLTASQVLSLVKQLESAGRLHCLQLLHWHVGSQIPNLSDIRHCAEEAARFYAELRRLRVNIGTVDAGGGLGVDYEGTGTRHFCSMNYSIDTYAHEVVKVFARICVEQDIPRPDIFSESGRALTAHHAMLVVDVIDNDPAPTAAAGPPPMPEDPPEVLRALSRELATLDNRPPTEVHQEARLSMEEVQDLFGRGRISLEQRAQAEALYFAICSRLLPCLQPESRRHRKLIERLNEQLADRLFCNFSIFQSLPDVWAIDQIFPLMPLQRLTETPDRRAILHDLTCDSDGYIRNYVVQDGLDPSLPVHRQIPGEPYLLGIFLVGAYQEILGDMHNLFGDTDAVNLELDGHGGYRLREPEKGDSIDQLLSYLHFSPAAMCAAYRSKLQQAGIEPVLAGQLFNELEAGLHGYSYFEE